MNPFSLINILLHAGAVVPDIQQELTTALTKNWSKGIVQDFVQGVDILSNIVKTVAAGFELSPSGIEEAVTTTTDQKPAHTTEEIEAAKAVLAAAQGSAPVA